MNRQDLRLPTAFLLDAAGRVVKAYRDRWTSRRSCATCRGSRPRRRNAWRAPCRSRGRSTRPPGIRNYLPYGRELLDQGLEAAAARRLRAGGAGEPERPHALSARHAAGEERAAGAGARRLRARARDAARPRRGEQRPRRAPGPEGDVPGGDRALPVGARVGARLSGRAQQPRLRPAARPGTSRRPASSTRRRSRSSPTSPRPSTTWDCSSAEPATWIAPSPTSARRSRGVPDYGEAANNLALVLVARGASDEAIRRPASASSHRRRSSRTPT